MNARRNRKELVGGIVAAGVVLFGALTVSGRQSATSVSGISRAGDKAVATEEAAAKSDDANSSAVQQEHKPIAFLTATASDGQVGLTCFKSTPFFEATRKEKADSVSLRIRRAELPGFRLGRDYDEFFDGLSWQDARIIFEGVIPALNNRKYVFTDKAVTHGQTYAYWVGTDRAELPTGAAAVRVRDPRVWWSWDETERRLEALAAEYPGVVETREVGDTVHGRRLRAVLAGRRDRTLVLVGSIHAGESGAELIIPAFEKVVREHRELVEKVGLAILPRVNADGRERLVRGYPPYLRTNSNGVDLNRNFAGGWETVDHSYGFVTTDPDGMTYRGASPASEPETMAVVRLVEGLKPAAVLSYHHVASITGSVFLYPKMAATDSAYVARCQQLNRVYRAAMAPEDVEKKPVAAVAGCTGGSLPAWIYTQFGAPAFDVEGDSSAACARSAVDMATSEDLKEFQDRHARAVVALLTAIADALADDARKEGPGE
ncbi:MAG TPA: M14 family metallopeptidase [Thermoguttaceae bacterium]|nr:M14 family metallopeptidase [Thermoguttaceae bacterium]